MLQRTTVDSSLFKSIGYDEKGEIMEAEFRSDGSIWQYGLPSDVFRSMREAPSIGSYFHKHIRPHYEGRRIG